MHYQVYVPSDLRCKQRGELVGYKISNTYVVIDCVDKVGALVPTSLHDQMSQKHGDLLHIGRLNGSYLGIKTKDQLLHLRYDESLGRLVAGQNSGSDDACDNSYTVVTFVPPNLRNLEYFTVRPILLQSTGQPHVEATLMNKLGQFPAQPQNTDLVCVSEDEVLDKINQCRRIRALLHSRNSTTQHNTFVMKALHATILRVKSAIFILLHTLVSWLLAVTVPLIRALNSNFHGTTPVQSSAWCKQLDLRLRQVSYFPIQFLCYYNNSLFSSKIFQDLELPEANSRHNINNSNYINLYNSLWLIVNDVLVGITAYRVYTRSGGQIVAFFNEKILENLAFGYLSQLITWFGSDHPGGFKLNNELGHFLESMFVWTLEAWKLVMADLIKLSQSEIWIAQVVRFWFMISCCCGVSFLIAALIDYISIATLHIYYFNLATTKIFHRQMEMLKSLTQLFRGKKYNVLRNRIDNLDEDQFHIDQLLVGTFIFMILIYLLPTTFAFYLLFFVSRICILTCLKIGNKVILFLNLYPLFVVLLKLKNSRRLQGGLYFQNQGSYQNCNWLKMENKALTFDEIVRNFVAVFRKEGRFRRFAMNFVEGLEIAVEDTQAMKFHYLMLPGNYDRLINVWQNANVLTYH